MSKKRKKRKPYFGKEVQNAIIRYNEMKENGESYRKRSELFKEVIHPAFKKMAENVINKWKIHNFETSFTDLQNELISFMYSKMPGYNEKLGRAYSYFTVICRNYSFQLSNQIYKRQTSKKPLENIDFERNIQNEISNNNYRETLQTFLPLWCDEYLKYVDKIHSNDRDCKIAIATLEILKSHEEIDVYNKKILYVLIREYANVETQYITRVIKIVKKIFFDMFNEYLNTNSFNFENYLLNNGHIK